MELHPDVVLTFHPILSNPLATGANILGNPNQIITPKNMVTSGSRRNKPLFSRHQVRMGR